MWSFSSLFGGGFEGISKQGMANLTSEIKSYCNDLEKHINSFNANGDLTKAVKGSNLEAAARDYVTAIKSLLTSYVTTYRLNVQRAEQAYAEYEKAEKSVSSNVQSNAQAIRNQAAGIRVD